MLWKSIGRSYIGRVCSCAAKDRTNGPKRAQEMRLLWKTTGAGSVAALALEEFGQPGSLEAERSAKVRHRLERVRPA